MRKLVDVGIDGATSVADLVNPTPEEAAVSQAVADGHARQDSRRAELRALLPRFKVGTSTAAERERGLFLVSKIVLSDVDE